MGNLDICPNFDARTLRMNELFFQLALAQVPNVGDIQARTLIKYFGDATSVFKTKGKSLRKIPGLDPAAITSLTNFNRFDLVEKELLFIEEHQIKSLFISDAGYPSRLQNCPDAPIVLFLKGNIDLNESKFLAVVGTRRSTEYGKELTETLIKGLAEENVVIVSGLAYGIDAIAHKAALKNNLKTLGVVAHGLDMIYPAEHHKLARDIVDEGGGLLSELFSGSIPDKHNFPLRNRIVAGMTDATIVIETPIKGGSMITARLADAYNRDVFAAPGRATDRISMGCNHLIKHNEAIMFTEAKDILTAMGWGERQTKNASRQRSLFMELSVEEQQIIDILQQKDSVHIDELNLQSGLSVSHVASVVLNLELQNIIKSMPGKMYKLL